MWVPKGATYPSGLGPDGEKYSAETLRALADVADPELEDLDAPPSAGHEAEVADILETWKHPWRRPLPRLQRRIATPSSIWLPGLRAKKQSAHSSVSHALSLFPPLPPVVLRILVLV
jgi:hypothetical protein